MTPPDLHQLPTTTRPRTVVGAVILEDGRVVAARRSRPVDLAGRWEFPGGKVEDGETPQAALVREIREELGATIAIIGEVSDGAPWPISDTLVLRLFLASVVSGPLRPGDDHDELRRLGAGELDTLDWLPSDRQALDAVRDALRRRVPSGPS